MMDKETCLNLIVGLEGAMFLKVNGNTLAECQEDMCKFSAMRRAQFEVWSEEALNSYEKDLEEARKKGRNLLREKYIRMMETTDPEGYLYFKKSLPPVTGEKKKLVADIWAIQEEQTRALRRDYPVLALLSRPLSKEGEIDYASIENYQTAELITYSEETLGLLLTHIRALQAQGEDYTREIMKNTVLCQGFSSLEKAEEHALKICEQEMEKMNSNCRETDSGVCSCDYGREE